MKSFSSCLALVALVSWTALYAQAGKLSDQEFRKLAASHGNAEEHMEVAEGAEAPQLAYTHPQAAHEAGDPGAAAAAAAAEQSKVTVYKRGQTNFNRRFFETKFAGFLRMVPGEAEKDMEIYFKSTRGEHVGSRLTRILQNEVTLQVAKGDATAEVIIPFVDIYEVHVRPKTA